jgi:hypothetical protein
MTQNPEGIGSSVGLVPTNACIYWSGQLPDSPQTKSVCQVCKRESAFFALQNSGGWMAIRLLLNGAFTKAGKSLSHPDLSRLRLALPRGMAVAGIAG